MGQFYRYLIFTISLLLMGFICFIGYKLGQKKGIKKSLYTITYRSFCVIFSFIVAPYVNEFILNYDLYKLKRPIKHEDMYFYRVIDFVEEVIVHNEVLNDIYNFVPSLKNLLMDFPQILTVPFVYVITFIAISLLLFPLYAYLSYKRKRRTLYEKSYNNKPNVWAGVINSIQVVFLVSIILTPINGLSRIYKDSSKNLISDESNICLQNKYLEKYDSACKIIEGYNSSIFALIGNNPINEYVYESLTRISYDDNTTSLNKEVVSIARAGLVLNKLGLLDAINVDGFEDVKTLNFKGLTTEDIDVVVEAFETSLYTKDVVLEVHEWCKLYLDWLIEDFIGERLDIKYEYGDVVGELKIVLNTIKYILDNKHILDNINAVYEVISDYNLRPKDTKTVDTSIKLFFDIVYAIDVDFLINLHEGLKSSKIFNDIVPQIIDHLLLSADIHITSAYDPSEFNIAVNYALNIAKIIQNHRYIYDVVYLISELTTTEVHYLADVVEYLSSTKTMKHLIPDLIKYGIKDSQIEMDLPVDVVYNIKEWDRELELVQLIMEFIYEYIEEDDIDYSLAWHILTNYDDTILFETAYRYAIDILPDIFTMWVADKGYEYLVGEYVV